MKYEQMVELMKAEIERHKRQLEIVAESRPDNIQLYVVTSLHEVIGMVNLLERAYGFDKFEELNEIYEEFHNEMREEYGVV